MPDVRFLQIHSLHGYSAALLNRDDSGLAKRITYGGIVRTRVSSQCLKRHWRKADGVHALQGIAGAPARRSFPGNSHPARDRAIEEQRSRSQGDSGNRNCVPNRRLRRKGRQEIEPPAAATRRTGNFLSGGRSPETCGGSHGGSESG